ncbi:hypothetical protein FNH08_03970 [Streptomyces spongiae]|uniref:Uncharacterized protein n=1 Tax=Streptomyces spongiae TaxID=565072 RepID=A0A5N8XAZ2_9ACTN|nr:hypothetical protein [Streptomyces spongiae]
MRQVWRSKSQLVFDPLAAARLATLSHNPGKSNKEENVRRAMTAIAASSMAVTAFVGIGFAGAAPAHASQYDCYEYVKQYMTRSSEQARAHTVCGLGESMSWEKWCTRELDKLHGVSNLIAESSCELAWRK